MNAQAASEKLERELISVRHKKILKIKTRIDSGKYHIDARKLAKALFMAR